MESVELVQLARRVTEFERLLYHTNAEELREQMAASAVVGPAVDQALNKALGVPLTVGPHQNKVMALLAFCLEQYDRLGLRAEFDLLRQQIKEELKGDVK